MRACAYAPRRWLPFASESGKAPLSGAWLVSGQAACSWGGPARDATANRPPVRAMAVDCLWCSLAAGTLLFVFFGILWLQRFFVGAANTR